MAKTRADRIDEILVVAPERRMRVAEIREKLVALEGFPELDSAAVSVAVRQDNVAYRNQGKQPRFNVYKDGTEHFGYVSLTKEPKAASSFRQVVEDPLSQIPLLIEKAAGSVRERLRQQLSELTWQEFEANFLTTILGALGFADIEITQRTRDGGVDAYCRYRRGLVTSYAIVSAKHWKTAPVPVDEVDRVRGIPNPADAVADTGIVVTSSTFTGPAIERAKPAAGMRQVVLIDGAQIVETCIQNQIGVEIVELPRLYRNKPLLEESEEG